MPRRARSIAIAAVAAWALVACFFRLGEPPVVITNEAREGVYVRAMLRSGDFVAPLVRNHVENDELVPDKPPLFHWVAAAVTLLRSRLSGGPRVPGPDPATALRARGTLPPAPTSSRRPNGCA